MKSTSTSDSTNPEFDDSEAVDLKGQNTNSINLSSDPDYPYLLDHYQNAEFDLCKVFLNKLEQRYPGNQELGRLKEELEIKLSLQSMEIKSKKWEKRKNRKVTLNLSLFAIFGTIIMLLAFFFSRDYFNSVFSVDVQGEENVQLISLNQQAEQLLDIGQPQTALEIVERIRIIDPEYENLLELTERTEELLKLDVKYRTGLDLISENEYIEAKRLFDEIQTQKPGLWDVSQQISMIEDIVQIENYLQQGNTASQEGNWEKAINSYESALLLDPKLDDPVMKEQLLQGYLNEIIRMLQNENTAIDDVELVEQYYRKAVALIPQNIEFANERGNLQELSINLLEQHYTKSAKSVLADKNQNANSIAKAVSYLRRATNIKPKNTALQQELINAEYYQLAFQEFVDMNWVTAISNLNEILSTDINFANGNANILLFEAYYALGKQYYSAGLHQDAVKNLELAEILAWDDPENLLKLFRVQVLLGDALGNMGEFENAVSYYKYALNSIEIIPRMVDYPLVISIYSRANILAGNLNYEDAFASFHEVLQGIDFVYSILDIEINGGACLAFFASENQSTIDAIIEENALPKNMVISFGRNLKVPKIEN